MEGKEILIFMLPIITVLPFGGSFLREYTSGFWKFSILRKNKRSYVSTKVKVVGFHSLLLFLFLGAVGLVIQACFVYPISTKNIMSPEEVWGTAAMILRLSMTGSMLASLSGAFGALFLNYYMAYGLPFVLYYMMIILKDRYLKDLYCISPKEWILPENPWGPFQLGLWGFLLILLMMALLFHGMVLHMRLKEIS